MHKILYAFTYFEQYSVFPILKPKVQSLCYTKVYGLCLNSNINSKTVKIHAHSILEAFAELRLSQSPCAQQQWVYLDDETMQERTVLSMPVQQGKIHLHLERHVKLYNQYE